MKPRSIGALPYMLRSLISRPPFLLGANSPPIKVFFFPFSKNTGGQYQPKYHPILYKQNLKFIHNLSKKKYLAKLHKFWLILAGISLHPLVLRIPVTGEISEISAEKKKNLPPTDQTVPSLCLFKSSPWKTLFNFINLLDAHRVK
jgi:hypothetical protein